MTSISPSPCYGTVCFRMSHKGPPGVAVGYAATRSNPPFEQEVSQAMENDKTLDTLLAVEHSRFHIVNAWPESKQKHVLLIAIQHSISQIARDPHARSCTCLLCRRVEPPYSSARRLEFRAPTLVRYSLRGRLPLISSRTRFGSVR